MTGKLIATWQWAPSERPIWSAAVAPLLGLDPDYLPGTLEEFVSLVHPLDRACVQTAVQSALLEDRACHFEFRLAAGDHKQTFATTLYPLRSGSSVRVCAVCWKQAYDLEKGATRSHSSNDSQKADPYDRHRVMGRVVHDLRNPLSTLLIRADLMSRLVLKSDSSQNLGKHLAAIGRCVRTMQRLLSNWETYAGVVSDQLKLERKAVSTEALVVEALDRAQALASERTLLTDIELQSPEARVVCDPERVVDAICNLVAHAVTATQTGDCIGVSARQRDGTLQVRIEEGVSEPDGLPLNGEDIDPGLRLDLFVARKVMEAQGGTLKAECEHERGACLTITLPLSDLGHSSASIQESTGVRAE